MILTPIERLKLFLRPVYDVDKTIIIVLLLLATINIIVQYSANDRVFGRLITDIIYLGISFILLFILANISMGQLKHIAIPFYIFCIILLVAVLFFGIKVHGAKRWLNLGIRIQPSELCKLSVPILLAYYFSLKASLPRALDYVVALLIILLPFAFIAKQPDLGTGILVVAAGFFVMFFAGLPWKTILISCGIFLGSTPIIWHFLHDYQKHRLLTLLNPQSDPLGKGYHIIQGIIAIGSGGLYGKGYLNGTQIHLDFIPEKHTDFVISVLAEEFGYIGVCTILVLYLLLILRGLSIMQKTNDPFARLLAGSITLSLMLYVLINMGMVSGILPVVGVPLPLISYGGTATMVLMIGFGMLLSIEKQSRY